MTLCAVWIEETPGGSSPLCFASDARTTPGPIEGVTKVILFGREDLVGVWAGDYRFAMLILNHLDAVFTASDAMRRRDVDVGRVLRQARVTASRHIETALRPLVPQHRLNADAQEPAKVCVLVGGYSALQQTYVLLKIAWNAGGRGWESAVSEVDPARPVFIGDDTNGAQQRARQARAYRDPSATDWRMEPLNAIYCACLDPNKDSIGGTLQLAKTYRHGSARAYAFDESGHRDVISLRGTAVDRRAARELEGAGLLIPLSSWDLKRSYFSRYERK